MTPNQLKVVCVLCDSLAWVEFDSIYVSTGSPYFFECSGGRCATNDGLTEKFPGHCINWEQMSVIKARLFMEQNEQLY